MKNDTAGDPITGLKWTHKTTEKIAQELKTLDINISANTVSKILKQLDFSLCVNHKKKSHGSSQHRDQQFNIIDDLRQDFATNKNPIISVDTKKKEYVGTFKNAGKSWSQEPIKVNDHDFLSYAKGVAVPFGIYDIQDNSGMVVVGQPADTSIFAVDAILKWWVEEGSSRYNHTNELLILADSGGSNGCRRRGWKYELQHKLCNPYGLTITVAHYPTGASKWNPIEHRLFSDISKNWAGKPLTSWETILKYIRTTATTKGLRVKAFLNRKKYLKGIKISDEEMAALSLKHHEILPKWNYTIRPEATDKSASGVINLFNKLKNACKAS